MAHQPAAMAFAGPRRLSYDPATLEWLGRHVQVPWNRNPSEYRAFAESYDVSVKPLLVKAGLAKG